MTWQRVDLSADDVVGGRAIRLQEAFEKLFLAAGAPLRAALFSRDGDGGSLHLYFSPMAAQFAAALVAVHSGSLCHPPGRDNTTLLVGHDAARESVP